MLLFRCLDYGLSEEEERTLSPHLERLIESLTSCDPSIHSRTKAGHHSSSVDIGGGGQCEDESRDEGIECDHSFTTQYSVSTFDDVIEVSHYLLRHS